MEYKVLSSDPDSHNPAKDLEDQVVYWTNDGWECIGGVSVAVVASRLRFFQAIIKKS